jgi:CSLREA domain-containing protein
LDSRDDDVTALKRGWREMRKYFLAGTGAVLLLCLVAAVGSVTASPDTYTVNSTNDTDDGSCDPLSELSDCTLREAIHEANSDGAESTIVFNIPLGDAGHQVSGITGTWTISLTSGLPILTEGGTIISGTTQAAFIGGDPNPHGPEIEIAGADGGLWPCLAVQSADNVIHGLAINRCPGAGIWIGLATATGNIVSGNCIGTDAAGTSDLGNGREGVAVAGGQGNAIGGSWCGERNIISGNGWSGVTISGDGSSGNVIAGNYIGTDRSGTLGLGNDQHGVLVLGGAQENTVGPANLVFGNDWAGVRIDGFKTLSNTITQNSIYNNGWEGISLVATANGGIAAPSDVSANCAAVSGTAPANSAVEVFTGPDNEGKTYLATCSADGDGKWSVLGPFALDAGVTATATDTAGNTSQFSITAIPGACHRVLVPLVMKNY